MLVFDPDTTIESLETNVAFMRFAAEYPSNFGRVELYAGTPLLSRMLAEGRCRGDYMQWDYALASPAVERVFALTMECFHAAQLRLGRAQQPHHGHALRHRGVPPLPPRDIPRPEWLAEGKEITRALTLDSCEALAAIVAHVKREAPLAEDAALVARARAAAPGQGAGDRRARPRSGDGASTTPWGRGRRSRILGDRVATPLQTQRLVALAAGA